MNPPYQITPEILKLIASVSEKLGQINAKYLDKPSVKLRKENQINSFNFKNRYDEYLKMYDVNV